MLWQRKDRWASISLIFYFVWPFQWHISKQKYRDNILKAFIFTIQLYQVLMFCHTCFRYLLRSETLRTALKPLSVLARSYFLPRENYLPIFIHHTHTFYTVTIYTYIHKQYICISIILYIITFLRCICADHLALMHMFELLYDIPLRDCIPVYPLSFWCYFQFLLL